MKKSLLCLAVLCALVGEASAQSSVTVYGLLNVAVVKTNGGTATTSQLGTGPASDVYQLASSWATSRLGFRGNEDLGGGLSAQFQIEHRFLPDTGAAASATSFWNGRSFVQLTKAGVGYIYAGRDYTPIFWVQLKTDPFANDDLAQSGSGATYAGYLTPDQVGNGARTSNSVGVKTASFGGFTAQATVGLSEATQQGRVQGVNAEYTAGPIYAGVGWEKVHGGTNDKLGLINVGVSYDFGFVKPMGYYGRSKTRTAGTTNGTNTNHVWSGGVTAPVGPGLVKAMYYKVDPRFANNTRQKLGLGYDYFLSKRTNLYAEYVYGKEDLKSNNKGYALGIKHLF